MTTNADNGNTLTEPASGAPLKILVVEDDFVGRKLLVRHLSVYGNVDVAVDGAEAIQAFYLETMKGTPYDFICLDVMMPELDGQEVLKSIRETEGKHDIRPGYGVKIIMTTALDDSENIMKAFTEQCDAYLVKPIRKAALLEKMAELGLIETPAGQG